MSILLFSLLAPISQAHAATITSSIGTDVARDYSTITAWEAALGGAAGGAGNDAVGEVYNDAVITEPAGIIIDDATPDSILITVPVAQRHNGIKDTGARIESSVFTPLNPDIASTIEWIEITNIKSNGTRCASIGASNVTIAYIICTVSVSTTDNGNQIEVGSNTNNNWVLMNSILFNSPGGGIRRKGVEVGSALNNTVYNAATTGIFDGVNITLQNNISVSSGTIDYNGTTGTQDYNLASDTSANGLNSLDSRSAANQFISTAAGTEDLHLKGGADAIGRGLDLGTTPSGIEIDIDGGDRDAAGIAWDIGADQIFDATNPSVNTLSPTDGSTSVGLTDNLIITFTEAVDVETGNINLYKASDDSVVETIDVTSANVTGTGTTTITINPTGDLEDATDYYVQIDATAFDDTAGNSYAGINDTTTWNFSTTLTVDEEVFSIALTINGGGLAKRGDILKGTLSLTNTKGTIITNTDVRLKLPQGINYIADTATSSDNITLSRIIKENHDTLFRIASFPRNAEGAIDFKLIVGSNVQDGETLTMTIHTENS